MDDRNRAEYVYELEAWSEVLSQAVRNVFTLLASEGRRPRLADDLATSLETLAKRIRRTYPTRNDDPQGGRPR